MHFGATLRLLRVESGLSLRDLARRIGVSGAYLSRVENGLDPVPTVDRLQALARELKVPAPLLMESGQRVGALIAELAEARPEAGAVFLEIAERNLSAEQLAEVRNFVRFHFPKPNAPRAPITLSGLLSPDRLVLQLECEARQDVLEVGAARFSFAGPSLVRALVARESASPPELGFGLSLTAVVQEVPAPEAVLVTLARPQSTRSAAPPIRAAVLVVTPRADPSHLALLAHIARLSARGLVPAIAELRRPEGLLHTLRQFEAST